MSQTLNDVLQMMVYRLLKKSAPAEIYITRIKKFAIEIIFFSWNYSITRNIITCYKRFCAGRQLLCVTSESAILDHEV